MKYFRLAAAAAIPIRYVPVLVLVTVSVWGETLVSGAEPPQESLEDRLDRVSTLR